MKFVLEPLKTDPESELRRVTTQQRLQDAIERHINGGSYEECAEILGTEGPAWLEEDLQHDIKLFA
jgi:hypothetical protein